MSISSTDSEAPAPKATTTQHYINRLIASAIGLGLISVSACPFLYVFLNQNPQYAELLRSKLGLSDHISETDYLNSQNSGLEWIRTTRPHISPQEIEKILVEDPENAFVRIINLAGLNSQEQAPCQIIRLKEEHEIGNRSSNQPNQPNFVVHSTNCILGDPSPLTQAELLKLDNPTLIQAFKGFPGLPGSSVVISALCNNPYLATSVDTGVFAGEGSLALTLDYYMQHIKAEAVIK